VLTPDTIISYCMIEYRRDPGFRAYLDAALHKIRVQEPSIIRVDQLIALRGPSGVLVGKALLDDYNARCVTPQWQRAKAATGGRK